MIRRGFTLLGMAAFVAAGAAPARAGDFKGNGGSVVFCPGEPVRVLDYFEAEARGGKKVDLGEGTEGPLGELLRRLESRSPRRARAYREQAALFEREAVFLDGIPIDDIPDTGEGATLPPGCVLRQAVNQNPRLLPAGKRYLVDRSIWAGLSAVDRAGLVLHELFYRESSARTSSGIRALNAELALGRAPGLSAQSWSELLDRAGLPYAELQGVAIDLSREREFESPDLLRAATAFAGATTDLSGGELPGWEAVALRGDRLEFHLNGKLRSFRHFGLLPLRALGRELEIETHEYGSERVTLHSSGAFQSGPLAFRAGNRLETPWAALRFQSLALTNRGELLELGRAEGKVRLRSREIPIPEGTPVRFHPSGRVWEFFWGTGEALELQGARVAVEYRSPVTLDEAGAVRAFTAGEAGRLKGAGGQWVRFVKGQRLELGPDETIQLP